MEGASPFRGLGVGERIGRFRIDDEWSTGPFGPTTSARMLASDRAAILHCLPSVRPVLEPTATARLVSALRALEGTALVPMIDAWEDPRGLVVAMEDLDGPQMRAFQGGVGEAVDHVRATALALAPSHHIGIVHGALAPELLRVAPKGEVRVGGLGITSLIDGASLLRVAGLRVGRYLSPEQIRGERPTEQSDIYALGAILYDLLAGRAPFGGATASALFTSIAQDSPPALPSSIPHELRAAITRALSKSPAQRYSDVETFARTLEGFGTRVTGATPRPRIAAPADDEVVWGTRAEEPSGRRTELRGRSAGLGKIPRFTGALAQQQLAFARKRWGDERVARAMSAIPPADRDELESATAVSWVRVEAFERFHVAFARELGRRVEDTHPEMVAGGSKRTFDTLWRMLLRVGGARIVMTRGPVVYSKTYDTGTMESRDIGDDGGRFVLLGWPDVPEFVLRGLRAGITEALQSVGRTGVVLTSTRTPDGAMFVARWDR